MRDLEINRVDVGKVSYGMFWREEKYDCIWLFETFFMLGYDLVFVIFIRFNKLVL